MKAYRTIGIPGYRIDEKELRRRVAEDLKRQMAAALVNGDRRVAVKRIKAPTIVVHFEDDPLVPLEGGRDTGGEYRGGRTERNSRHGV